MNKSLLEILKDLSAVVVGAAATLYIFGFVTHLAYFRLLGIEMVGQPLDYVRLAADYFISLITSLPQLLLGFRYYLPMLVRWPLSVTAVLSLLVVMTLLALWLPVQGLKAYVARKRLFAQRLGLQTLLQRGLQLLISVCLCAIVYIEYDVAAVRDVLQPVDPADIQQMQAQPFNAADSGGESGAALEIRGKNVVRVYRKYMQTGKDAPGFGNWNTWFNPLTNRGSRNNRRATYLALLSVNVAVALALVYQLIQLRPRGKAKTGPTAGPAHGAQRSGGARAAALILSSALLFQLILFSYVYVTLGRYFVYPVVSLKIDRREAERAQDGGGANGGQDADAAAAPLGTGRLEPSWTHCVYLIAQTDAEVVVYDRLNYFQIKHVPRSRVMAISQLFNASPFESCSKDADEFEPCEVLWMPESKPLSDF